MENVPKQMVPEQTPSAWQRFSLHEPILVASFTIGAVLLAFDIFRWTLIDWLTLFIALFLELFVGCALLIISIWSVVYLVRRFKKRGAVQAAAPLLVNVGVLLIILFVPFNKMTIALNFKWNYHKRMEVVSEVLDGKLVGEHGGRGEFVYLPARYQGLSGAGSDIMVDRRDGQTLIFFFDFRGILDSFAGFVYTTGNVKPRNGDFGGQFIETDQVGPHWWWVSSAN